ncbi:hypothetical protein, variant 2 [Aphanomyces invadans]|uniref:Magnesium transporter n=1 Tax=Aphanomyces invadans TaxID=157072 RepID=A0A024UJF8_9STRA|nr:hypothetical protein, variant 2 [Aphanomyces invadans]ETW06399.1 hypothetical protein, variant 2 [Aphanomyces invadans]|eukprot:XP_008864474.1 hypothetical protein, variant 2 [Aphanomyces invadans]
MSHFAHRAMLLAQNSAKQASYLAAHPPSPPAGPSDDADEFKWIGLAIVIGSAILSNLGVNVQKLSHVKEEKRSMFQRRPYYVRPLWIIGMAFVVLGSIGDFEALAFAPQALVASVGGGCTVLANMGFAHLWLGQRLTWYDVLGTFFILVGVVLSTLANTPDAQLTIVELELQFQHLEFLVYFSIMCLVLFGIFGEIRSIARRSRLTHEYLHRRLPYLYATASGIFGSFSVLLAKCTSMLLLLTFQGDNQFVYPITHDRDVGAPDRLVEPRHHVWGHAVGVSSVSVLLDWGTSLRKLGAPTCSRSRSNLCLGHANAALSPSRVSWAALCFTKSLTRLRCLNGFRSPSPSP